MNKTDTIFTGRRATLAALFGAFVTGAVLGATPVKAASDEEIALSLATMLRSARSVISDKQKHINNPDIGDKGLSADAVIGIAKANYKKATGTDVDSIDPGTLQGTLINAELKAIADVMNEAQSTINEKGVSLKGFLPAVFARLVTQGFKTHAGDKAMLKLTAPKEWVRNRANRPDNWEHKIIQDTFNPHFPDRR